MLDVANINVAYGKSAVLQDLSFSIAQGEIVAMMGRNGMGKTTLMKSLIGILPLRQGSIRVGDTDVSALKSYQRVAAGLGYVPQSAVRGDGAYGAHERQRQRGRRSDWRAHRSTA